MKRNVCYENARQKETRNCTHGIFQIASGSQSTNKTDKKEEKKVNWKQLAGRMQEDRISEIT
jgi:hypothetical protein